MPLLDLFLASLLTLAAATILYSIVVWSRISRGLRVAPPADQWADAPEPPGGWPSAAVVVPAHNEERVIARLARSLAEQDYPNLRIVFALDRCTDGTRAEIERAVGADERVEIVEIDECPEDWAGKTHAAWTGHERSAARQADVVLFTDADTWHHPRCLRASVAAMRARGLSLLSLLSTLEAHHAWEHALQPTAVLALLRQYPLDRINRSGSRRSFANGQFLLFSREAYHEIGGHHSVRGAILEDLALAREIKHAGRRWGVLPAGRMLKCRMYPSRESFLLGWRRIFIESSRRVPRRLRGWATELVLTGVVLPLGAGVATVVGAMRLVADPADDLARTTAITGAIAIVSWLAVTARLWRAQGAALWSVPLAPLGAWTVASVLRAGASDLERRRTVRWGGREYDLAPNDTL
jgi:chlorobactene glucosyltransferase